MHLNTNTSFYSQSMECSLSYYNVCGIKLFRNYYKLTSHYHNTCIKVLSQQLVLFIPELYQSLCECRVGHHLLLDVCTFVHNAVLGDPHVIFIYLLTDYFNFKINGNGLHWTQCIFKYRISMKFNIQEFTASDIMLVANAQAQILC